MRPKKPGTVSFFLGVGILGLALVSSVAFGIIFGGPLILGGLALMVRGLTATSRKAAGSACADCSRTIVFEHQAEFCERCNLPLHAACMGSHVATAHKIEQPHPFR
jgi:hypothetical protein